MNQKKVAGIGIYEKGKYPITFNGKLTKVYSAWSGMLVRCNPESWDQKKYRVYEGCSAHPEFHHFQDFAEWCHKQPGHDIKGWHLDKDILFPGNKVYGPDTCCFVPTQINSLLLKPESDLPTGITFYKPTNKYIASISIFGIRQYLGCSDSIDELIPLYQSAKSDYVVRVADRWKDMIDPRVYAALICYADSL